MLQSICEINPHLILESAANFMKPNNMNLNNRIDKRIPFQRKCIMGNRIGLIETQTVDMSKMGLGVKTDRTLPFKDGCELTIFILSMKLPQAKLMWTKKDSNNTTKLGLKFLPALWIN